MRSVPVPTKSAVTTSSRSKPKAQRESSRRPGPGVRSTLGVTKPTRRRQKETPVEQPTQYVGIDLHRRRSVIVRRDGDGETLDTVRIDNDPVALAAELVKAGEHPEVILEATYGWYWATDVIKECGGNVHLFSTGVYSYRRPLIVTEAPHRRSALRSLSKVADCIRPSRVF